ncbi:MAG: hypothetical protein KKB30_16490 [Proteobacteria bacterium]|nr:hypothetical protein [Pseudomonadota bacterium]MBU1716643.1 hypothetical protein [Pseudomonadota bacterium]
MTWSEKLHLLSTKIDRIPSIDKYRLLSQIEDLHIIMTELDDRLCELLETCPVAGRSFEASESGSAVIVSSPMKMRGSEFFDYDFGG